MAKVNQIVAIENGAKSQNHSRMSEIYKTVQKPELFYGFVKSYRKKDEEGEDLPGENKHVVRRMDEVMAEAIDGLSDYWQITARKEWSNCEATANVEVDGQVFIADAPVTFLLFLEKQLVDIRSLVNAFPTLEVSEDWSQDVNSGLYKTPMTETHRTKKIQRPIVLYDATEEHPAQTQMITEDVIAGFWQTTRHSGALPNPQKKAMLERVEKLIRAVKSAREAANSTEETSSPPVAGVLSFIFHGANVA